jgi:P27 family predicted phage terminase small subunit
LLAKLDRAALAGYCVAWARWVEAEKQLKEKGLMVKTPNGFEQPSPWLNISNKALEQLRAFASEFGMSPATRSRVEALPIPKAGDRAREARKQLLFGEGNGKLAKYLRHEADEADTERRFFGDA